MAARPIIASIDGEGCDVVVASGAGIACPAEDAAALAEAVIQLADTTPERRAQMGAAGRAYYERTFEPTMLTKRLLAIFRVVIDAKSTAKTRQTAS